MMTEISEQEITEKIAQLSVPSRLGVKTSLGPITALLDLLGRPEQTFPTIHVGGTSGKGSTSTFLANILSEAGYKVGLFTKPHLSSVRERFVINHVPITPGEIMALMERIARVMDEKPTWFELTTLLAFQYFADQQVDFGVIEVGLGGTCDATNVILPEMSILTNVGLDHTEILGDTVEKIAEDKVGIVKAGRPVISSVTQPSVIDIIEAQCRRKAAPLKRVGRDFHFSNVFLHGSGSTFDLEMEGEAIEGISLSMPGAHQVTNASTAAAAAAGLRQLGYDVPAAAIISGLQQTQVPGRMEIIEKKPLTILDGAHSPPKMEALVEGLRTLFADKQRMIGVLSFSKGHDARASLASLAPLLDTVILTEFNAETDYGNKRAQDRYELAILLYNINPAIKVFFEAEPCQAVEVAQAMAGPDDLVCVTGSIFLVGQVREHIMTRQRRALCTQSYANEY